jgi:hypothetical protein
LLGLRRFKNVQIDIWQGDIDTFAADGLLVFSPSAALGVRVESNKEDSNTSITLLAGSSAISSGNLEEISRLYHDMFLAFDNTTLRHLIIPGIPQSLGQSLNYDSFVSRCMTTLRNLIDSGLLSSMRRVTFVARDLTVYDMLQKHLFAEFPDELDEEGY